jgi:hypothetical protein
MTVRQRRPKSRREAPVHDQFDGPGIGEGAEGVRVATVPAPLGITEDRLAELAMAADPNQPMDADAVPLSVYLGGLEQSEGLLPQWYMPTPMARSGSRWRLPVVLVIVAAFVIIEAAGLCSTFGQLVPH